MRQRINCDRIILGATSPVQEGPARSRRGLRCRSTRIENTPVVHCDVHSRCTGGYLCRCAMCAPLIRTRHPFPCVRPRQILSMTKIRNCLRYVDFDKFAEQKTPCLQQVKFVALQKTSRDLQVSLSRRQVTGEFGGRNRSLTSCTGRDRPIRGLGSPLRPADPSKAGLDTGPSAPPTAADRRVHHSTGAGPQPAHRPALDT